VNYVSAIKKKQIWIDLKKKDMNVKGGPLGQHQWGSLEGKREGVEG
jgi:hypothetical protein